MSRAPKRDLDSVLTAIRGSDGIKTIIAKRLKVTRQTVDNYLGRWAKAREAYAQEVEGVLDLSESVVIRNIKLALGKQNDNLLADSTDARWYLTMKGNARGYAKSSRMQHVLGQVDFSTLTDEQLAKIAAGEDVLSVITSAAPSKSDS
jgi:hypothetical protein